MDQIKKIVHQFAKPGTTYLSSAILKERRYQNVTAICKPQSFTGARFMERESQIRLLDSFLFQPKNAKGKRDLITAVASSGMGKSAFTDEYCRRTAGNTRSCIHPIAITYNTLEFGPHLAKEIVTVSIDLAARLIMSYFLSNPSPSLLGKICKSLREENFEPEEGMELLQAVVACIQEDLRMQSGVRKSKILIACDEVGKSSDEKQVVQLLTLLVDSDDELECFFTGLSLNPFLQESLSGRFLKYVPLPLLTFASSLSLVQSFIKGSQLKNVSSKLARLSGGHPRTIQLFETFISNNKWSEKKSWRNTMVRTVVESTMVSQSRLSVPEIMLLVRPQTLMHDIQRNDVLIQALQEGKLYATIFSPDDTEVVELFTSSMLLRSSLLLLEKGNNKNALIKNLNEILKLVGLLDLHEFRVANAYHNGKIFENFYLCMEKLRRGFQESELGKERIKIANLYPTVTFQQNCDDVNFKLASSYDVEDVSCQNDFPSIDPADAAVFKRVQVFLDSKSIINKVIRPTEETQAAYDFFFILKGPDGSRYVQLIEPTLSAGGPDSDAFFINRYLKKLEKAESLAWNELGIDAANIVHTFVSTGNTSGVPWKTVFENAGYSDRRVLILDRTDLSTFFGPMLNVLFSYCFSD